MQFSAMPEYNSRCTPGALLDATAVKSGGSRLVKSMPMQDSIILFVSIHLGEITLVANGKKFVKYFCCPFSFAPTRLLRHQTNTPPLCPGDTTKSVSADLAVVVVLRTLATELDL